MRDLTKEEKGLILKDFLSEYYDDEESNYDFIVSRYEDDQEIDIIFTGLTDRKDIDGNPIIFCQFSKKSLSEFYEKIFAITLNKNIECEPEIKFYEDSEELENFNFVYSEFF